MREYLVEISIEVDADTPRKAAEIAWDLLSGPDTVNLPVCHVHHSPVEGPIVIDLSKPAPEEGEL